MPRKAFVLAAGLGTRTLPLSRDLPKPLMQLWGRPLLVHILRLLARWGVRDVLINCHHLPGELVNLIRHVPVPDLNVALSFEPEIQGTGGALRRAAWFFDGSPFWLINADIAADVSPAPFVRRLGRGDVAAVLWLESRRGPRTVEMRNGLIHNFSSAEPGKPGTFTFCGLSLLHPDLLRFAPTDGSVSLVTLFQRAMRAGKRIAGIEVPDSFWADLGTPADYLQVHGEVRERFRGKQRGSALFDPAVERRTRAARRAGAIVEGFAALGRRVHLTRGARLRNAVVWDDAELKPGAVVENSVVGRNAIVQGRAGRIVMPASAGLAPEEHEALSALGWDVSRGTLHALERRGSARTFSRFCLGRRSAILVRYDPARRENALYAANAAFLARLGLPVPRILADRPKQRLTVLEDLGDVALLDVVPKQSISAVQALYRRVLDAVLVLHHEGAMATRRARLPLMPRFGPAVYRYEHDLFLDEFVRQRTARERLDIPGLHSDLLRVSARLRSARPALIHRDLQSSNILVRRREVFFIDFQGMRLGPAAYDLASLLCDPYVELEDGLRERLLEYYLARSRSAREVRAMFWWATIERLAQALGAFGRLRRLTGEQRFEPYVAPALRLLRCALQHVEGLPALRRWVLRAAGSG